MVGYDPYSQIELSTVEYGLAGTASGVVTRCALQPLDVIKIRFQLQIDPVKRRLGKYHGVLQAFRVIVREEGPLALWKGHLPGQGLSIVFGVVQFATYEWLSRQAWLALPDGWCERHSAVTTVLCGAASGATAVTCALPLDVVRTRLIAQGEPKIYRSVTHAVKKMWVQEGFLSFYRGFVPTVLQIAPSTGIQFGFYTFSVQLWNSLIRKTTSSRDSTHNIGALQSLVCGGMAGTGAKIVVYPLDLFKKRLQKHDATQRLHGRRKVQRQSTVVSKEHNTTYFNIGLFKGLVPSLLKASAMSGCGFFVYEQVCRLLIRLHSDEKSH